MAGYTKLFSHIVHSTIWREPHHVRLVWVTMLALSDAHGQVMASVPGLADAARVTEAECDDALAKLGSPDPRSRSPVQEGRRILAIDGGWELVNHAKYKRILSVEERRDYDRERKRQARSVSADCPQIPQCHTGSQPVTAFLHTAPAPAPDPFQEGAKAPLSSPAAPAPDAIAVVRSVFEEWQRVHSHPSSKLDAKRTARIRGALKLRSPNELRQAIRGALKDDWLMGRDPKSPRKYDGLETILRDAAQIERLIDLETGKAKPVGYRPTANGASRQTDAGVDPWAFHDKDRK